MTTVSGPRVILVGAGRIAHAHAEAIIRNGGALVAVVDVDSDAARTLADKFSIGSAVTSLGDALRHGPADAAIVCSPTSLHASHASEAIGRGLHVLVEKPFASELADARGLVSMAHDAGRVIMSAQVLRYMPMFTWAKNFIEAGHLGRPIQAIERRLVDRADNYEWWAQLPAFLVSHWGSHSIDLLCHLFEDRVKTAYCQAASVRSAFGVVDDFSMQLVFGSGLRATSAMSFSSTFTTHDIVLIGEKATLTFDCYRTVRVDGEVAVELSEDDMLRRAFAAQFIAFRQAIESGGQNPAELASVLAALEGLNAAELSAVAGDVVVVENG